MIILVDMDGVAVDMHSKWLELYNIEYNQDLKFEDVTAWNMKDVVVPEAKNKIYEYLHTPGFFADLPPYPGAIEGIQELHEAGHKVYIVSAPPPGSDTAARDKLRWCRQHLPFLMKYPPQIVLTHHTWLLKGDLLLDDSPHNLEQFEGDSVAMSTPYNRDVVAEGQVESWSEFVQLITLIGKSKRPSR
jgi:5'(3')-deoxyribonucleotidase